MRMIARNSLGKIADMILTIPMRKVIKKFLDRLINRHMIRIQVTYHVFIPQLKPFIMCIHCNTCHQPFIHRMKIKIKAVPFTTFHL